MSRLFRYIRSKAGRRRGEEHRATKTGEEASPPSSGYNSSDDETEPDAGRLRLCSAQGGACQTGNKPFYDYNRLHKCYPDYLTLMQNTIVPLKSLQWVNANVAEVNALLPPNTMSTIQCNPMDGTAVYRYKESGPYGPKHQTWSTLNIMLYEFGNCYYGLFALNLADNYAMTIKQDQSDTTRATVNFEYAESLDKVQRFQMRGTFEKLCLSATDGGVTYHLYAASAPSGDTDYGTLTAVSDSKLAALSRVGGTIVFNFQRPLNMRSSC